MGGQGGGGVGGSGGGTPPPPSVYSRSNTCLVPKHTLPACAQSLIGSRHMAHPRTPGGVSAPPSVPAWGLPSLGAPPA